MTSWAGEARLNSMSWGEAGLCQYYNNQFPFFEEKSQKGYYKNRLEDGEAFCAPAPAPARPLLYGTRKE